MDHPDNSWMMPMNMNSNLAPPPQLPAPGFSAACTELFARRPEIFDIPSGGNLPMMQSAPPADMDAFRNNFMFFQPQPEPQGMNAWMCGGSGGGNMMSGGGMMSSRGSMAAMMLPDDENEGMYFAQSANGGGVGGGGVGVGGSDMGDLGAGDMMMGMGGGCPAGWMMGRQPAGPGDWGSGGGGSGVNGNGSFHPAAMSGLGPMMGHRNLLPDI